MSLAALRGASAQERWTWAGILLVAALLMVRITITVMGSDSKTMIVLASLGAAALPIGAIALRRPLIVPFAAYAFLVPFDNLLTISSVGTLTKLLAICSGAALVLWILRYKGWNRPQATVWWWAALLGWSAATLFWAIDANAATSMLATYAQLFLVYVVLSLYPAKRDDLRWILGAVALGGVIAATYGVYLFRSGGMHVAGGRLNLEIGSTSIDPNHFSAALLLPVAIVLGYALSAHRLIPKLLGYAALAALISGIYVSGSRGAMIAATAIFVWYFFRTRHRSQLLVIGAAVVASLVIDAPSVLQRFSEVGATGGSGRSDIWRVGLTALRSHWLIGAGVGNFPFAYDEAFIQTFSPLYVHWHKVAHDLLLSTAVELGLLGVVLLLAAWYKQFSALAIISARDSLYEVRVALEAGLIAIFVAGIFLDLIWYKYAWLVFDVAAIVVVTARRTSPELLPQTHEDTH